MTYGISNVAAGALLVGALVPTSVLSQPTPTAEAGQSTQIVAGMLVVGPGGAEVGRVEHVEGSNLTLATDRHQVRLPLSSFTSDKGKLLFALTRDQLNQEVEKSLNQLAASLTKGAVIHGAAGSIAGTIEDLDDQFLVLKLTSGTLVRLPRSSFGFGPNGPVLGISSAELDRLAAQASSPPPSGT